MLLNIDLSTEILLGW